MSSIGFILPIALSRYLVVYNRGSDQDGTWRGYFQSFDELTEAQTCGKQFFLASYGYVIYDLVNAVVISQVAPSEEKS